MFKSDINKFGAKRINSTDKLGKKSAFEVWGFVFVCVCGSGGGGGAGGGVFYVNLEVNQLYRYIGKIRAKFVSVCVCTLRWGGGGGARGIG